MRLEHLVGFGRQRRILDPGLRERCRNPPVQLWVRRVVDRSAAVLPFQVDDVDDSARRELRDELVRPVGRRVELEAQIGVELEPRIDRRGAVRGHEAHGFRLALECGGDVEPVVLERIVERGRLERPPAVVAVGGLGRRAVREEVDSVEMLGERAERPRAAQVDPRERVRLVLGRVVGDVFADSVAVFGARACFGTEVDDRRAALELRADLHRLDLHRHVADLERQVAELLPEHQASLGAAKLATARNASTKSSEKQSATGRKTASPPSSRQRTSARTRTPAVTPTSQVASSARQRGRL